jgi:hypothetical protein
MAMIATTTSNSIMENPRLEGGHHGSEESPTLSVISMRLASEGMSLQGAKFLLNFLFSYLRPSYHPAKYQIPDIIADDRNGAHAKKLLFIALSPPYHSPLLPS